MYAHQVIEFLWQLDGKEPGLFLNEEWYPKPAQLIFWIENTHKFHFGETESLPYIDLTEDLVAGLRLPYPVCCFEFWEPHPQAFFVVSCQYNEDIISFSFIRTRQNDWFVLPIALTRTVIGTKSGELPTYKNPDLRSRVPARAAAKIVARVQWFTLLLNCKNITTKVISKDKENLKRARKNLPPLYSYHVLQITSPGANKGEKPRILGQGKHRQHWCRGHFKHYTEEAPLFGKYTGLYYWESHLRGDSKRGFADKDYEYVPPKEEE